MGLTVTDVQGGGDKRYSLHPSNFESPHFNPLKIKIRLSTQTFETPHFNPLKIKAWTSLMTAIRTNFLEIIIFVVLVVNVASHKMTKRLKKN